MEVSRTTVPGTGTVHHLLTRGGVRFAVLAASDGGKHLLSYGGVSDEPTQTIVLGPDEADQLADLLHSTPLYDRVARLEHLLGHAAGNRGGQ